MTRNVRIWIDVGDRPVDGPKGTIAIHDIINKAMKKAGFVKNKDYTTGNDIDDR